jgi:hypothetical protein
MRGQSRGWWAARTIPVAALVASSVLLAGCGSRVASPTCTTRQLIEAAGKGFFKLPPSHDNDAGKGRIPDTHPDLDIDANQRAALCKIYMSRTHSRG